MGGRLTGLGIDKGAGVGGKKGCLFLWKAVDSFLGGRGMAVRSSGRFVEQRVRSSSVGASYREVRASKQLA